MNKYLKLSLSAFLSALLCLLPNCVFAEDDNSENSRDYIKWIDFDVTSSALADAAEIDVKTYGTERHIDWIELLSLYSARTGGDYSHYKKSDIEAIAARLRDGETASEITSNEKLYAYYTEAYGAILSGMLGEYTAFSDGGKEITQGYGVRAFSPVGGGFWYSDFDDFGAARSFGYARPHLGHDMMGSVGTPIICIESGYVDALGWNMYGGWRVGIRSFDGKRYYYYAHLRRGHPYADLYDGKIVNAGEVIGYLGMTGYSSTPDKNNINTPHLHVGLQIIFDASQKDGYNQIWIDMYELSKFLLKNRAPTYIDEAANERVSRCYFLYPDTPD